MMLHSIFFPVAAMNYRKADMSITLKITEQYELNE